MASVKEEFLLDLYTRAKQELVEFEATHADIFETHGEMTKNLAALEEALRAEARVSGEIANDVFEVKVSPVRLTSIDTDKLLSRYPQAIEVPNLFKADVKVAEAAVMTGLLPADILAVCYTYRNSTSQVRIVDVKR